MTSQLLINEPPLQVLPTLASVIGLNEAIVLQQIHYWLNPRFNTNFFEGQHWVHNTYEKWKKQFPFWSEKTVKRTIMSLEESKLLVSFLTQDFRKTKYYTINYDRLNQIKLIDSAACALPESSQQPEREEKRPETEKLLENTDFQSTDQKNPLVGSSCPDRSGQVGEICSEKTLPKHQEASENQGLYLSRQHDLIEQDNLSPSRGTTCPLPSGQSDSNDRDNLTRSHTEITPENSTENTLPPLLPLSTLLPREPLVETQEEEDEEINLDFEAEQPNEDLEEENFSDPDSREMPIVEAVEALSSQNGTIFLDMIEIWNVTVQKKINSGQGVYLTEKRQALLRQFMHTVFVNKARDEQLDAWKGYCALIANSRFLTGENSTGFRVTFDWALIPEKAYKILEGAIYDQSPSKSASQGQYSYQSKGESEGYYQDEPWEMFFEGMDKAFPSARPFRQEGLQISQHLARALGQAKYKSWFSKMHLGGVVDATATFFVEGNFIKDYVVTHFTPVIIQAVQTLYPEVEQIVFQNYSPQGGNAFSQGGLA